MENFHRVKRPMSPPPSLIAAAALFIFCSFAAGVEPKDGAASTAFVERLSSPGPLPDTGEAIEWRSPTASSRESEENAAAMQSVVRSTGLSQSGQHAVQDALVRRDYTDDRRERDESDEGENVQSRDTPTAPGAPNEGGKGRKELEGASSGACQQEKVSEHDVDAKRPLTANNVIRRAAGVPRFALNVPEGRGQKTKAEPDSQSPATGAIQASDSAATLPVDSTAEHYRHALHQKQITEWELAEPRRKSNAATRNVTTAQYETAVVPPEATPDAPGEEQMFRPIVVAAQAELRDRKDGKTTPCNVSITGVSTEQQAAVEGCLHGSETQGEGDTGETSTTASWLHKEMLGEEDSDGTAPERTLPSHVLSLRTKGEYENTTKEDIELGKMFREDSSLMPRTHFRQTNLAEKHYLRPRDKVTEEGRRTKPLPEEPLLHREVLEEENQNDKLLKNYGESADTATAPEEQQMEPVAPTYEKRKNDVFQQQHMSTPHGRLKHTKEGNSAGSHVPESSSEPGGQLVPASTREAYGSENDSETMESSHVQKSVASTSNNGLPRTDEVDQKLQLGKQDVYGTEEAEGHHQRQPEESVNGDSEPSGGGTPYERATTRLSQDGVEKGPLQALQQGGAAVGKETYSPKAGEGPTLKEPQAGPSSSSSGDTALFQQISGFPLSLEFSVSSVASSDPIVDNNAERPRSGPNVSSSKDDTEQQSNDQRRPGRRYPSEGHFVHDSVVETFHEDGGASTLPSRTDEQATSDTEDVDSLPQMKLEPSFLYADSDGTNYEKEASHEDGETDNSMGVRALDPEKSGTKGETEFIPVEHRTREEAPRDELQTEEGTQGRKESTKKAENDPDEQVAKGNALEPPAGKSRSRVRGAGADTGHTLPLNADGKIHVETSAVSEAELEGKLQELTQQEESSEQMKERGAHDQNGEQTRKQRNEESTAELGEEGNSEANRPKDYLKDPGLEDGRLEALLVETATTKTESGAGHKKEGIKVAKMLEKIHSEHDVQQQTRDTDKTEDDFEVVEEGHQVDGKRGTQRGEDKIEQLEPEMSRTKTELTAGELLVGTYPAKALEVKRRNAGEARKSSEDDLSDVVQELVAVSAAWNGKRGSERQPVAAQVRDSTRTSANEKEIASLAFPSPGLRDRFTVAPERTSSKQDKNVAQAAAAQVTTVHFGNVHFENGREKTFPSTQPLSHMLSDLLEFESLPVSTLSFCLLPWLLRQQNRSLTKPEIRWLTYHPPLYFISCIYRNRRWC
ncbi:UNVERIFIED_CONTAM: hypothetical protein HHA_201640 [Hammondia hammondi]|eukprot:XP_008884459.1 hypothetical protein HHA_201640 [Hammondia hammondi]